MNISGTPTCYYPLTPTDKSKIDTSGHVTGDNLRNTRGYERLVEILSQDGNPSPAAPLQSREARDAVDGMKIKAGTILLAPCHQGHTAADRSLPAGGVLSDNTAAPRSRRQIAQSAPQAPAQSPTQSAGESTGTGVCQTIGVWHRVLNAFAEFLGGLVVSLANDEPAKGAAASGRQACPTDGNGAQDPDDDVVNYERYLQAWAMSASA
ncbi:hypothetical protein [Bordetella genomosp. 11]|uniref:Uncharacterized protein n=1 Tax=Bordetella genomosp. 11 TaxID=1416808 RepID=A0A261UHN6_9BORD|nr:hypothetical protein [Bordetella genomosp. 11]OZI61101.1 hypothetical protein CAL28_17305 [Bordetella genomosp. 11]